MRKSKKSLRVKKLWLLSLFIFATLAVSGWLWFSRSDSAPPNNPSTTTATPTADNPQNDDESDGNTDRDIGGQPASQPNQPEPNSDIEDNSQEGEQKFDNPPRP